jgi:hypothetical protein
VSVREAEQDARQLLEASWWWEEDAPGALPVDPFEVARDLGLTVQFRALAPDESGHIVIPKPGSGPVVITLNSFDHPIGHYIRRRRQGGQGEEFIDYRDTLAGLGRDPEEIYANQFAAALLMPARLVQRYRHEGAERLARRFGTSEQAMEVRLRNLGLA